MSKVIKNATIFLFALIAAYFGFVFMLAMLTKYTPEEIEQISRVDAGFTISDTSTYSALIWNIGYGGLSSEMDFFYDGGEQVRGSEDQVRRNLHNITQFLVANDSVDFILLQEIDKNSKRSYGIDIEEHLNLAMAGHFPFFAYNYKVNYVPVPLFSPLGKVHSGILTLSKHVPVETKRYSYPGKFKWPTSLYSLDRCFLSNEFILDSQKKFVLVNTHNSAFDDGSLRRQQMDYLQNYLQQIGEENIFLVGGDWNQSPNDFEPQYNGHVFDTVNYVPVHEGFLMNGWKFIYENTVPTNRRVVAPYVKGESYVTTIDYFLKSPGIEVLSLTTIDLDFSTSDHQPVILSFRFR